MCHIILHKTVLLNGNIEKHRTVQEKARTLLSISGLSTKFWSEAVKMPEFLINRYPLVVLNGTSSYEKWFGYSPNYSIFHPFGRSCVALIPPEQRKNIFAPVSAPGILVGYSPMHKAFRIFVFSLNDIIVSNNVRFNKTFYVLKFEDCQHLNKLP